MRACQPSRDGYVERDGVKVHYEVYGDGEPTVLLLPTWSIIHSRHWKMQIPLPGAALPGADLRRARQRALGPADGAGGVPLGRVHRRRPGRHGRLRHRAGGAGLEKTWNWG
jgi:hypothetical protein